MKRFLLIMFSTLVIVGISACGTKDEPDVENTLEKETEITDKTEEDTDTSGNIEEDTDLSDNMEDDAQPSEHTWDTETRKNPDEQEYISCTMDGFVTEMYGDIEAVIAKYSGKYMEITGILDKVEIDEGAGSIIVRMKTMVEPPVNMAATVQGNYYSWETDWLTMEECKEMVAGLTEGDEVILRGYAIEDFSIENDGGWCWCSLQLIDVHKK